MSEGGQTRAAAAPVQVAAVQANVLQRACACGQHTHGGGECEECKKQGGLLQLVSINAYGGATPIDPPGPPSEPSSTARGGFAHDFSRVRVRLAAPRLAQPRLIVGPTRDQYEEEADRVAAQVMRMPALPRLPHGQSKPLTVGTASTAVQRQSYESDDTAPPPTGAQEAPLPVENELSLEVRRKTTDSTTFEQTHQESNIDQEAELSSSGQPLPAALRWFYEQRFGRNFEDVRIHTGAESTRHNRQLHAYAFTYGYHIWLGHDVPLAPSFILAHELAHVIQQKQPKLLNETGETGAGGTLAGQSGQPAIVRNEGTEAMVRRFAPYWEPAFYDGKKRWTGTKNHSYILPDVGKVNNLFTEAPVPQASTASIDVSLLDDAMGYADLYRASTTVGVFFTGHRQPAPLKSRKELKKDGERYDHVGKAAPAVEKSALGNIVTRTNDAPQSIEIADLKPSHGTLEASKGVEQVQNYLEGFKQARDEVNNLETGQTKPPGSKWNTLKASAIDTNTLTIPDKFKQPTASGQNSLHLVLKTMGTIVHKPVTPVLGKVYVSPDPINGKSGVLNYAWIPDKPVHTSELPKSITDIWEAVDKKIKQPLTASPVKKAKKARPEQAPLQGPSPTAQMPVDQLQAESLPIIRRSPEPAEDSFNLETWQKDRNDLQKQVKSQEKSSDYQSAQLKKYALDAYEATRKNSKLNLPATAEKDLESSRRVKQVEFWTGQTIAGKSSTIFGPMRKIFGGTFVKVANAFQKAREKFRTLIRGKQTPKAGGGLPGAALRAALTVLRFAAAFVVRKTFERLMQSLQQGITKKLKALIDPENVEELEQKIHEVEKLKQDLEQRATETVEALADRLGIKYEGLLKDLETAQSVASIVTDVISMVRWGARLLACVSPPAWGCLWIIGQGILEKFAQMVVETCWFQREITPLIAGVQIIQDLPKTFAQAIIEKVREILPDSLHDIFADIDTSPIKPTADDIDCDGDDTPLDEKAEALRHLAAAVGEDRLQAFGELSRKFGIKQEALLTAEQIRHIESSILSSGVSAEEMKRFAEQYPKITDQMLKTKFVDVEEFLNKVKNEANGVGAGGGKPSTISLDPNNKDIPGTYTTLKTKWIVETGVGANDYKGATVNVQIAGWIGQTPVRMRGIKCIIVKRTFVPNVNSAERLEVYLEANGEQFFDVSEHKDELGFTSLKVIKGAKFRHVIVFNQKGQAEQAK
jgi:hypothetical protein